MYAHHQYRAAAAETAGPAQLVLMLYDAALARIERARGALSAHPVDGEAAHDALTRAQAIVEELTVSLDHEQGGQMAANLAGLYRYCSEQLIEANLRKDGDPLPAVERVLRGLRDAWETACVTGAVHAEVAG